MHSLLDYIMICISSNLYASIFLLGSAELDLIVAIHLMAFNFAKTKSRKQDLIIIFIFKLQNTNLFGPYILSIFNLRLM